PSVRPPRRRAAAGSPRRTRSFCAMKPPRAHRWTDTRGRIPAAGRGLPLPTESHSSTTLGDQRGKNGEPERIFFSFPATAPLTDSPAPPPARERPLPRTRKEKGRGARPSPPRPHWSAQIDEPVQDARAEAQRVDRNPLVDAV